MLINIDVHPQRQTRRMVRILRHGHGTQHLDQHHPHRLQLERQRPNLDRDPRSQTRPSNHATCVSPVLSLTQLTSPGTFHPHHIVLATGHSGEPSLPTDIKDMDTFRGDRLCHSSAFDGPKPGSKGKKAVVVGSCNSGHDIARDYYEHGYDVMMVQRSSTLVLNCQTIIDVTMKGLYSEDGVCIVFLFFSLSLFLFF